MKEFPTELRQPQPRFKPKSDKPEFLMDPVPQPKFNMGDRVSRLTRLWIAFKRFVATGVTTGATVFAATGSWEAAVAWGTAAGLVGGGEKYAKETAKANGIRWVGILELTLRLAVGLIEAWNRMNERR